MIITATRDITTNNCSTKEDGSSLYLACTNLVKKKNTKNVAWNYLGVRGIKKGLPVEGYQDKPISHSCRKVVLTKRGHTTNLFQHLKEPHPTLYAEGSPLI